MRIENLTFSFGPQDIFRDVSLNIRENEKIGIIGVNGAGKTTFFKIITGELEPDLGKVVIKNNARVELLPQVINDEISSMDITVFDFLMSGRPIQRLDNELQKTYDEIAKSSDKKKQKLLFSKVEKIQGLLNYWEYYTADSELLKIISGMSIKDEMLNQKLYELSGGQKSNVAFAKLLYSKPEIILLDEPTNHLDKETKDFVINYIKNYKGSVYVISHDISFLNQITTMIIYLDKRTKNMKLYKGNYDRFLKLHNEKEEAINKIAQAQEKEIEHLQNIITKYSSASGKRKRMVQDREKKLEKLMDNKKDVIQKQKNAKVEMSIDRESSNIPLKVDNICFKYNKNAEKGIIQNLSFELFKGEKFLVVGENGVGKSTLLKLIISQLKADSGSIIIGNKTDIGYYAQEHELLDNEKTIIENFSNIDISRNKLRSVLGRYLFYGDDVFKKVEVLSPGEKSRVALAKLSLQGANLLILDEPTNHLDPETQNIIAETFITFSGTMLIVSHNPEFVDNLGIERTLILPSGKISYYDRDTVEYFHDINTQKKNKSR
ncbi:MAG: ABC-F family ATP-binding cassette domain-containing protein [Bacilli bacterium]|nr:ABC-F family ATP-binding cassette domain-containing protein [Bacilli bacterium]MDD4407366.1 ABC-F family ATP-binding cassette domain-containing protein [Bacilli bacterium]